LSNGRFSALYRNELEKIWAHRGRALIIAFILIVGFGTFIVYHSYQGTVQAQNASIAAGKAQVAQDVHQLAHMSVGPKRKAMLSQLTAARSELSQMNYVAVRVRSQVASLKASLSGTPGSLVGNTAEQLAMAQYRLDHGITYYHPGAHSGYRLVGQVFSGLAMLVFALVALGISADCVSAELEAGTWGGLLLHAPRRRHVYLAKLFAAVTATWAFVLASAMGFFVGGWALMGLGSALEPHVVGMALKVSQEGTLTQVRIPAQVFHILPQWRFDLVAVGLSMIALSGLVAIFVALSMGTRSTIFSFVVGTVLILSAVLAPHVGSLAIWDPAVHLPLISDWTRSLALEYNMATLSLKTGMTVVMAWLVAALVFSLWYAQRLDV